jgi:predicted DNA binding protein
VWVAGSDHERFAETVLGHPLVGEFLLLDRIDDSRLYRIVWETVPTDLIAGIAESEATVLEATGDGRWVFRLRFEDHAGLSAFHDYCADHGIDVRVERIDTVGGAAERRRRFGLSREQREALVLALRRGYFATPRETALADMAVELGISRQALSNRIRRGNEAVLRTALRPSVAGDTW